MVAPGRVDSWRRIIRYLGLTYEDNIDIPRGGEEIRHIQYVLVSSRLREWLWVIKEIAVRSEWRKLNSQLVEGKV